jgi:hypothetical protein
MRDKQGVSQPWIFVKTNQFTKNKIIEEWRLLGCVRRMALVTTDVSEELSASIIRVIRIGELGTTNIVPPKYRFLKEPHGLPIPEDAILHGHRREYLKSYTIK